MKPDSPYRCFDRRYLIEMIPAILVLIVSMIIKWTVPRTPTIRLTLVTLASLTVAYTVVMTVAAIRRLDELQQRVHLIAIAISFTVTGVVLSMTRLLEMVGVKHVPTGMGLWLLMFGVWTIGVVVLNRRYR